MGFPNVGVGQVLAHDASDDRRDDAERYVGPDPLFEPMVHRAQPDKVLHHLEAPFDILTAKLIP